jgi:DNA invertase Pin-like site-specific DNA recombinase
MSTGHLVGYARVSTKRQSLDQQIDALQRAGVSLDRIYTDKMSGKRDDRAGLAEMMRYVREGDTLVIVALDRLGRSLSGIIRTLAELTERGVMVKSLREGIDYSTPTGKMVAGIFASLAEYEHTLINERAEAAREAARDRGKHTGRPRALTSDQIRQARALRDAGESIAEIQKTLNCARSTLYRALNDAPPVEA